jgi:hypothetical protein
LPDFGILLQDSGQFLKNDGFNVFALQRHDSTVFSKICHSYCGILAYPLVCCSVGRKGDGLMLAGRTPCFHSERKCTMLYVFNFHQLRLQDAQTPPSSLVGEGGWRDEGQTCMGMQKTAFDVRECEGRLDPARTLEQQQDRAFP